MAEEDHPVALLSVACLSCLHQLEGGFVQLRYQFRVYPTPDQSIRAVRVFGCRRMVWNDALACINPVKAANKLLGNPKARLAEGPYQRVPHVRAWTCPNCDTWHDRDWNAARNVLYEGRRILQAV
ncbi:helix-turn-helix domain-containing protein [Streptomyces sp. NPDC007369]|uniref:helix-turn-helix domain-containing protein n=1 Tax=Streptomyces sp. NPDC007369 TaxID=3154589 RepID=UPI0033EC9524